MSHGGGRDRDEVLARLAARDGVAILPTDTVPGLHARLDRPAALAELARLKGRPGGKPFLVLVDGMVRATALCRPLSDPVSDYLGKLWPGPFTVILAALPGLPTAVVAAAGTVALRVPQSPELREFLAASGPLASTSVNAAGVEPATDLVAAAARFPDLPCWSGGGIAGTGQASALVDLTGPVPRLLRPGPRALPAWGGPPGGSTAP